MPEFNNLNDAFQWWIDNVYPKLSTQDKEKMKYFKYNFKNNRSLTKDKMFEILETYSHLQITIEVEEK